MTRSGQGGGKDGGVGFLPYQSRKKLKAAWVMWLTPEAEK